MGQKFVNNLTLQTSADISDSTSSIPVVSTAGLPTLGIGDWMYVTLTDIREGGELRWEVVKLNNYSSNVLSVTRGQDGTTGQAWLAGSSVSNRVTAGDMQELENFKDASRSITLTGDVVGTVSYTGTGSVSIGTTIASTKFAPVVSPALTGTPTAPTATAGTSTTQLATTAFVTATMGNFDTQQASSVSFTLAQIDTGRLTVATAPITFTLPPVNTIVSGSTFMLKASAGTAAIALNGNSSDISRLTILQGETVALQSDGGSFYRLIYRSSDLPSSLSTIGYSYMSNGLLVQWGYYTPPNANTLYTISLPIAFPNNAFIALSNPNNPTTTVATSQCNTSSNTQLNLISNTANVILFWIAIGN
jgi:hypothetical protein